MKSLAEVQTLAVKRFQRERINVLREALGLATTVTWPWVVPLGRPAERDVLAKIDEVLAWRDAWIEAKALGDFEIELDTVAWRSIGTQTVPVRVVFHSTKAVAKVAGVSEQWTQVVMRARRFVLQWPQLAETLVHEWTMLAEWSDEAVEALHRVLAWFVANPASGLYIRQLPIEGVDTKWFTEPRKKVVQRLLTAIRSAQYEGNCVDLAIVPSFETVCGLKPLPRLIRGRLLDDNDQATLHGLSDLTVPVEAWVQLPLCPEVVFISENLQTGLAFEAQQKSVVFFGLGASVTQLVEIPWVRRARVIYWGDIDTYGLEILAHLREVLPQVESVMMNRVTLERYRSLTVPENRQASGTYLEYLTHEECDVFEALKAGDMANLRLEQERIPWSDARKAMLTLVQRAAQ